MSACKHTIHASSVEEYLIIIIGGSHTAFKLPIALLATVTTCITFLHNPTLGDLTDERWEVVCELCKVPILVCGVLGPVDFVLRLEIGLTLHLCKVLWNPLVSEVEGT